MDKGNLEDIAGASSMISAVCETSQPELPPKPERPLDTDCCGMGCVPCVFDIYDRELALWEEECERLKHGASTLTSAQVKGLLYLWKVALCLILLISLKSYVSVLFYTAFTWYEYAFRGPWLRRDTCLYSCSIFCSFCLSTYWYFMPMLFMLSAFRQVPSVLIGTPNYRL